MSNVSPEEFEKAFQLRKLDFEYQKESIAHDSKRLEMINKQCDSQNRASDASEHRTVVLARFASISERVTSPRFLWSLGFFILVWTLLVILF